MRPRAGETYTVFGYKGKQVRDNIHSARRRRAFIEAFFASAALGEVYNLGGGRDNNVSILEPFAMIDAADRARRCPTLCRARIARATTSATSATWQSSAHISALVITRRVADIVHEMYSALMSMTRHLGVERRAELKPSRFTRERIVNVLLKT